MPPPQVYGIGVMGLLRSVVGKPCLGQGWCSAWVFLDPRHFLLKRSGVEEPNELSYFFFNVLIDAWYFFHYSTGAATGGELDVKSFGGGLFLALAAGDGRMYGAETYVMCALAKSARVFTGAGKR